MKKKSQQQYQRYKELNDKLRVNNSNKQTKICAKWSQWQNGKDRRKSH